MLLEGLGVAHFLRLVDEEQKRVQKITEIVILVGNHDGPQPRESVSKVL